MAIEQLGEIQLEDRLLLDAVVRMTVPKILVEFGHFYGASAKILLKAMKKDAVLHCYDIDHGCAVDDKRIIFHKTSQVNFEPIPDIDFVFIDASHDFGLNKETFSKMIPNLSNTAIIAVHDTGLWKENFWNLETAIKTDGGYAHQPDERLFVNWIRYVYPEFQQIHFHTTAEPRHGITLLQKYNKLFV